MTERREAERFASFREQSCLPFLLRAQNSDGGWGYHPEHPSSTEPTSWAVLALRQEFERYDQSIQHGSGWLRQAQQADGAWPAAAGGPGCWVTALACLALLQLAKPPGNETLKGLQWLTNTWPAEGNFLWRLRQRWHRGSENVVRQDHSLRGWGWTPGTAGWVEPTAYALILLRNVRKQDLPAGTTRRKQLGEKMLYDRMCPGGGWNAGNPMVYGVPGEPRIGPTAWSLLALIDGRNRPENEVSLDWLERNYESISGPSSLALAHLCLRAYGRPAAALEPRISSLYSENHFLSNVMTAALASLATGAIPDWLIGDPRAEIET